MDETDPMLPLLREARKRGISRDRMVRITARAVRSVGARHGWTDERLMVNMMQRLAQVDRIWGETPNNEEDGV